MNGFSVLLFQEHPTLFMPHGNPEERVSNPPPPTPCMSQEVAVYRGLLPVLAE